MIIGTNYFEVELFTLKLYFVNITTLYIIIYYWVLESRYLFFNGSHFSAPAPSKKSLAPSSLEPFYKFILPALAPAPNSFKKSPAPGSHFYEFLPAPQYCIYLKDTMSKLKVIAIDWVYTSTTYNVKSDFYYCNLICNSLHKI